MPPPPLRLRSPEYYADLARTLRKGETLDPESLLAHMNTVGYMAVDVVEMPGEYALRGGILDVYSPEADRPVRIEFFGDEIESIRKFDPATQRSSNPLDEALLLPLTETPVAKIFWAPFMPGSPENASPARKKSSKQAVRSGGVTVFPGWEFYAPVAGADRTVFDLLPQRRWWLSMNRKPSRVSSTTSGRASQKRTSAAESVTSFCPRSLSAA